MHHMFSLSKTILIVMTTYYLYCSHKKNLSSYSWQWLTTYYCQTSWCSWNDAL